MNFLRTIILTLTLLVLPLGASAQLTGPQGGTGVPGISGGSIPFGGTSILRLATSSAFQYNNSLSRLTVTNASTTALTTTTLCLDTCETSWPTASFDSTAVDATTWSDGVNASNIWTFNLSGTDTTLTFGSDLFTFSGSLTLATGKNFTIGTTAWNTGDALDIDVASLDTVDDNFLDVAAGGIGVGTLTDGGVLLGNAAGDLVAMAVLGSGAIIVGDGTTDPVALTAFTSSTGDLIHEAGGLEADVSAYTNGLYGQLSGATADVDTIAEIETAIGGATNILIETEIDASSELLALMDDETGTGALVFGTSPTIATGIFTGKIDRNNTAVDDDDCTGEQGLWWYDTTDSQFEWCNANSGTPTVLGSGGGDSISINGSGVVDPNFVSTGQVSFTDTSNTITANVTDDTVVAADLDATNAEADDDIVTYDSGTGGFTFNSGPELCVAITGGSDLCDGIDNASGGAGLATSTAIADTYMIYGTSASTVGAESVFTYDDATNLLTVPFLNLSSLDASRALFLDSSKNATTSAASAALAASLSDETGSGVAVFATSPTLVTPALGTIASGVGTALTALNGENIQDDTIDDDSIDFVDVTLADLTFDVGSVDTTEFGYLNGVTSAIQTQLGTKFDTAGRSLTAAGTTVDVDAELYTDTKCIWFENPTAADDFKSIWTNKTANAVTITEMWGESDQTVAFDLQVDDGTPADVNGTDISPAAGEAEDTSLSGDTTLDAGEELDLAITSVANTPTFLSACWTFTWND